MAGTKFGRPLAMDIRRTDVKAGRRRRLIGLALAGCLLLGIGGLGLAKLEPAVPAVAASAVWIDTVQRGEMLRQVRGTGVLVPREIRWVAAQSAGRVERILIKPGTRVTADSVLMELSNPDLLQQRDEVEWQLAAAQADLASLQIDLENQLLDRQANLAEVEARFESVRIQAEAEASVARRGIIPTITARQSELQAGQLRVRRDIEAKRVEKFRLAMQAQLEAQGARIKQLENLLHRRSDQVDNLSVRAGIDGVLQQIPVEEGQQIVVGASVGRVARPEELIAELEIPEIHARHVQLDQRVSVDTRNGLVDGRVLRIDPAVENGTVQVDVELIGELPAGARPDLTVDGTIEIERLEDVLYVGRPAYAQPDSSMQLFRVDGSDTASRITVRIGRTSVNQVEILEGLDAGDRVILSDINAWDGYDRVRVN